MRLFSAVLFAFTLSSSMAFSAELSKCEKIRASLDVGSGTAKALVAKVNICKHQLLETLLSENMSLGFNQAFEAAGSKDIPAEFVNEAIGKLTPLVNKIRALKPQRIKGAATSVFRKALNGKAVAAKISKALKIDLNVVSQSEEAHLGLVSAMVSLAIENPENIVVWDIGGGSMQMLAMRGEKMELYEGSLASVSFKNMVIEVLQLGDLKTVTSPNPLGEKKEQILKLAESYAKLHLPNLFKEQAHSMRLIGVGGVLAMSVQGQVLNKGKAFSMVDLEKTYRERAELSDEKIESEYKATDVTNLALVLGFMKALGVESVETTKVSLAQALLF